MPSPWKAIDQMEHDELRRYARDLVREWVNSAPEENVSDLIQQMNAVGHRMEFLGIKPVVKLDDRVEP